MSRLRHYVEEHQKDCDSYVTLLTYAYSISVHRSTKLAPFSFFLSRHPPGWASPTTKTMLPEVDNIASRLAIRTSLIKSADLLKRLLDKHLNVAHDRYKSDHDKKVRFESTYAPGDCVFVEERPLTTSGAGRLAAERFSKLMPQKHGSCSLQTV